MNTQLKKLHTAVKVVGLSMAITLLIANTSVGRTYAYTDYTNENNNNNNNIVSVEPIEIKSNETALAGAGEPEGTGSGGAAELETNDTAETGSGEPSEAGADEAAETGSGAPSGTVLEEPSGTGSDETAGAGSGAPSETEAGDAEMSALAADGSIAATTDVTVTNIVTGEYANKDRLFDFSVSLSDADSRIGAGEAFVCKGGVIPGTGATAPSDFVITLDAGGTASFALKHGQTVTIEGVPAGANIQIVEDAGYSYIPSFKDNTEAEATRGNDTEARTAGIKARTFDFTNDMMTVVPAGIEDRAYGAAAPVQKSMMIFMALLITSCMMVLSCIRKYTGNCVFVKLFQLLTRKGLALR